MQQLLQPTKRRQETSSPSVYFETIQHPSNKQNKSTITKQFICYHQEE